MNAFPYTADDVRNYFEQRSEGILDVIASCSQIESPTEEIPALIRCGRMVDAYVEDVTGTAAEWIGDSETHRPHLLFRFGQRSDALIIGHFDTVYPLGTTAKHGVYRQDNKLFGPGVLDMKGGIVLAVEALGFLKSVYGEVGNVAMFLNSDEETGAATSRHRILELAAESRIGFGFERGELNGDVRIGLRGSTLITITILGTAAHSAYPEHYVNPIERIGEVLDIASSLHDPSAGVVVAPTMVSAGNAINVVPNEASITIMVRGTHNNHLARVTTALEEIELPGAEVRVNTRPLMPAWPVDAESPAFAAVNDAQRFLGFTPIGGLEGRGSSNANFAAQADIPMIDGLGPAGDNPHVAGEEYILLDRVAERAAMIAVAFDNALRWSQQG